MPSGLLTESALGTLKWPFNQTGGQDSQRDFMVDLSTVLWWMLSTVALTSSNGSVFFEVRFPSSSLTDTVSFALQSTCSVMRSKSTMLMRISSKATPVLRWNSRTIVRRISASDHCHSHTQLHFVHSQNSLRAWKCLKSVLAEKVPSLRK
ncbi:hypothetical protein CC86DRAFT_28526 [Ophiobolus disseminans]|uniref:Uncharacterized protein n=1 Tax=Ophiobolus disseminans TaxID=1469910 RepID=A0A6A6ZZE9_9PLEO|nr:hypothetical protein CC86DRAFT_28526 [Ophiobolus disseminans]